ncbi:NlpC/P60 family protein [Paludisphaera borealis]|uniref:NlpC/P60 domain-containing protein n=1 Tax=Paludisphaera borealis TaxID=1387353 RepID=A0A1U7CT06_9BACT|nr:NlpC/P60 family protein [Paludisphaera borealis]APW62080.1 hypothetical protein BSF38_03612 [Paludisphaera borealis]
MTMPSPSHPRFSTGAFPLAATLLATAGVFCGVSIPGVDWQARAQAQPAASSGSYGVEFRHPIPDLIDDLLSTERGDPRLEASIPHSEWYSKGVERRFHGWGPEPRTYPPLPGLDRRSVDWKRERVIAEAIRFLGYAYQHHHLPDWNPPASWPWTHTCAGGNGKGFDCSNFTSFVYNQGFGIHLNSDVGRQATLEHALEGNHGREIRVHRVELPESYDERIKTLRTGDLVYIRHERDPHVSHVVIWVGPIGRSPSGVPLVIDSHGGGVNDDDGRPIPCGVQLRPYRKSSWYNRRASHAHRLFEERP